MAHDIGSTLDALVELQAGVRAGEHEIKKAWKFIAPQNVVIPETPCFMNDYTLRGEERGMSLLIGQWTIRSHLYTYDADLEVAAEMVTQLLEAYRRALGKDTSLQGNIDGGARLRGSDPTLGAVERAGRSFMTVETFLDFEIKEPFEFATKAKKG